MPIHVHLTHAVHRKGGRSCFQDRFSRRFRQNRHLFSETNLILSIFYLVEQFTEGKY